MSMSTYWKDLVCQIGSPVSAEKVTISLSHDSHVFTNLNTYIKQSKLSSLTVNIIGKIYKLYSTSNDQLACTAKVLLPMTSQ